MADRCFGVWVSVSAALFVALAGVARGESGPGGAAFGAVVEVPTASGSAGLMAVRLRAGAAAEHVVSLDRPANMLRVYGSDGSGGVVEVASGLAGPAPIDVVGVDLDGDGLTDFVVCNPGHARVSIVRQVPAGDGVALMFGGWVGVGLRPEALAAGDVTGDGLADIVTADAGGGTLTVLEQDGAGGLVYGFQVGVGFGPTDVAVAELTGEGPADVVVVDRVGSAMRVLESRGVGSFALRPPVATDPGPGGVLAADFDGDGAVDVAVCSASGGSVRAWWGDGLGSLTAGVRFRETASPTALAAGVALHHGRPAMAVASGTAGALTLVHVGLDRELTGQHIDVGRVTGRIVLADVDGDGLGDLTAGSVSSSGLIQAMNESELPGGVCPGDFNGDLYVDLEDFTALAVTFGSSVEPGTGADADGDGLVTLDDFSVLAIGFGSVCGAF